MKYIKTYEARSHPETNVDLTFEQYFNNILSKYSITDIFISFRSKDTLTDINPKNIWETPTGYYTFPLALYKNKIKPGITLEKFIKVFPVYWMKWSSEIKYVDFFILKDKTGIISSKTTTKELRKYIEKIKNKYKDNKDIEQLCKKINYQPLIFIKNFYDFLYSISKILVVNWQHVPTEDDHLSPFGNKRIFSMKLKHKFSSLCRDIGINGIIDNGREFIAHTESIQAVFFKIKSIGEIFRWEVPIEDKRDHIRKNLVSRRKKIRQKYGPIAARDYYSSGIKKMWDDVKKRNKLASANNL